MDNIIKLLEETNFFDKPVSVETNYINKHRIVDISCKVGKLLPLFMKKFDEVLHDVIKDNFRRSQFILDNLLSIISSGVVFDSVIDLSAFGAVVGDLSGHGMTKVFVNNISKCVNKFVCIKTDASWQYRVSGIDKHFHKMVNHTARSIYYDGRSSTVLINKWRPDCLKLHDKSGFDSMRHGNLMMLDVLSSRIMRRCSFTQFTPHTLDLDYFGVANNIGCSGSLMVRDGRKILGYCNSDILFNNLFLDTYKVCIRHDNYKDMFIACKDEVPSYGYIPVFISDDRVDCNKFVDYMRSTFVQYLIKRNIWYKDVSQAGFWSYIPDMNSVYDIDSSEWEEMKEFVNGKEYN